MGVVGSRGNASCDKPPRLWLANGGPLTGANSPVIRGRTAFKAMIESFNPNFTDHRIELRDINGYGDLAYAWGNYTETFSVSGAPEPITDVAKLMFGFRKQPDGSWLVATEMWNTDLS